MIRKLTEGVSARIVAAACATWLVLWMMPTRASQTEALTFHDLRVMTPSVRGAATLWPAVTETGSLFTGEMAATFNQVPHHHEQEQVTLSLSGTFDVTVGGVSHRVSALNAVIIPPNVPHFMTNKSGARARLLEYQPVARRDWLGLSPVPPPTAPPATLRDQVSPLDLSPGSSGWMPAGNDARVKTFTGKTIRMRILDVSARSASIDITAGEPAAQRFLYVLQGHATIAAGPIKRRLDPEIYVEVAPAAGSVILSSTSAETTIVAVFEPVSSSPAASRTPPGGDWTYRQHDRPARFPFYSTPMVVDEQQ